MPERVTVTVEDDDYRKLTALAKEYRISKAWVLRYALARFLEQGAKEELQLQLPFDRRKVRTAALWTRTTGRVSAARWREFATQSSVRRAFALSCDFRRFRLCSSSAATAAEIHSRPDIFGRIS